MGVRRVRDAAFWGVPVGTVIGPGMKPRAASKMARAATPPAAGRRPGSAAALFAAGAGKGRIHAATGVRPTAPAAKSGPLSIDVKTSENDFASRYGKAAAAVSTRKAATSAPKPAGASGAERKVNAAAADIRAHVEEKLRDDPQGWVGLSDLRDSLGDRYPREVVDKALHQLNLAPGAAGMRIVPVANIKSLTPRDRGAALNIGGEDSHMIGLRGPDRPAPTAAEVARSRPEVPGGFARDTLDSMPDRALRNNLELERERDPKSPKIAQLEAEIARRSGTAKPAKKAAPRTARGVFDAARVSDIAQRLRTAPSMDAARGALSGMTIAQLRQVAGNVGVSAPAKATKARLVDLLAEVAGRRLDAVALSRR